MENNLKLENISKEKSILWDGIKRMTASLYYELMGIAPLWGAVGKLKKWKVPELEKNNYLLGKNILIFTCCNGPWIQMCYIVSKILRGAGANIRMIVDVADNMHLSRNVNYLRWSLSKMKNSDFEIVVLTEGKIKKNNQIVFTEKEFEIVVNEMCWLGRVDKIKKLPIGIINTLHKRLESKKNTEAAIRKEINRWPFDFAITINGENLSNEIFLSESLKSKKKILCFESANKNKIIYEINSAAWEKNKTGWSRRFEKEKMQVDKNWISTYVNKRKNPESKDLAMSVQHVLETDNNIKSKVEKLKTKCKKIVLLATNCVWDTAVLGKNKFFSGIEDWVNFTIGYLLQKKNIGLIIRVHPHEDVWGGPVKIRDGILKTYIENDNLVFIDSKDRANSYQLLEFVDYGVVYSTTFGMEMVAMGIPVITCARVHYDDIGFTNNPSTIFEYMDLLDRIAVSSNLAIDKEKAIQYIYWLETLGFVSFPIDFENWQSDLDKNFTALDFEPFLNIFKELCDK